MALSIVLTAEPALGEKLLVHLPSAPIESSSRLANAVTRLRDYLSADVPGLALEIKIFRRWEDAHAFYQENPSAVTAILSEPSFLFDLASSDGFVPAWRFSRARDEFYPLVLIVRTDNDGVRGLSDVRGKTLQFVKTTGDQTVVFLSRAVFVGEVAADEWFASMEPVTDDFTAVAAVLHGQVDAALVADHNPLLRSELGGKLKEVFSSPPQPLPVLALRMSAFPPEQRSGLDSALARIGERDDGVKVLEELGLDGLRRVSNEERQALLRIPSPRLKSLEIALPAGPFGVAAVSSLAPGDVTFALAIELPETAPVTVLEPSSKPQN